LLIVMRMNAPSEDILRVQAVAKDMGFRTSNISGLQKIGVALLGDTAAVDTSVFEVLPSVDQVVKVTRPYSRVGREHNPDDTLVDLGDGVVFGGDNFIVIAGPCAVESKDQVIEIAHKVKEAGAKCLRGGAYKPRTSPYSFQGLGEKGLEFLADARDETGLKVVTEAIDIESLPTVARYADMVQIGSRNMQNFSLLKRAGGVSKPVLMKRGIAATMTETLMSAEHILSNGNTRVVLCERGVRNFSSHARNLLDLTFIPAALRACHLPVIADPSHSTGNRHFVAPMAYAALAAGAHGIIVEVHTDPIHSKSDASQALPTEAFAEMMVKLKELAAVMGKNFI
jgi:3-deoxy-7-phosphoheptulonate synthase